MKRRIFWGLSLLIAALMAALSVESVPAQAQQETLTPTPTETLVFVGPTRTPTNTLPPPPRYGGRVAVEGLALREGPSTIYEVIDSFEYGEVIYPIAISADGNWVAIALDDQAGWLSADFVEWDDELNFDILPVFSPPFDVTPATVTPSPSPSPSASPSPSSTPTTSPTETESPPPTEESAAAADTATSPPPPTEAPQPTDTPVAVAEADTDEDLEDASEVPPIVAPDRPSLFSNIDFTGQVLPVLGGGLLVIVLGIYGSRLLAARRKVRRYAGGFPLSECPVCQTGSLHLDEHMTRVFGIPQVRRSVRCDVCRSLLREVEPGSWRYMIDPLVNPRLAEEHDQPLLHDDELLSFATKARSYTPDVPAPMPDEPVLDEAQIVAEIEARAATVAKQLAARDDPFATIDDEEEEAGESDDDLPESED